MLEARFFTFSARAYFSLFFRIVLGYFKFLVFFRLFQPLAPLRAMIEKAALTPYLGLTQLSAANLRDVLAPVHGERVALAASAVVFANTLPPVWEFIRLVEAETGPVTWWAFLVLGRWLNSAPPVQWRRWLEEKTLFHFFFTPRLWLSVLYYHQQKSKI